MFLFKKFLKKISFCIIFVQRVMFWIKTLKRVRLRAVFYNSTTFESIILDESDFEQTSLTTDQISKWIWFVKKTDFDECFACRKSLLAFLWRKTPTSAVICFLKNHDMETKSIKSSFRMKNFERNQILKQVFRTRPTLNQEFQNMSDFQSTLNNSWFLESEFLQHVKFWNIFLPHVRFWSEILTTFLQRLRLFKKIKNFVSMCKLNIHIASELGSRFLPGIKFRWKNCF